MQAWLAGWKDAAPAIGALTAIASAIVALIVFSYTRKANRRRATLDMVMKTLLDDGVQRGMAEFKSIMRRDKDEGDELSLRTLSAPDKRGNPDRVIVLRQLNIYELMALGIKKKLFDESFYKRWYHNQFMLDYESCSAFITGIQENKSSIFCECSSLYQKWLKHGHPEHTPNRFKMAWWGLTSQNHKIDDVRAKSKAR